MGNNTFAQRYQETAQPWQAEARQEPTARQVERATHDVAETVTLLRRVGTRAESVSQAAEKLYTAIQSRAR